jgi:hypothetical protein
MTFQPIAIKTIRDEVLDFLVSTPTPEQVLAFQASEQAQERMSALLEANRNGTLTQEGRAELDEASELNHLVILLKARARKV